MRKKENERKEQKPVPYLFFGVTSESSDSEDFTRALGRMRLPLTFIATPESNASRSRIARLADQRRAAPGALDPVEKESIAGHFCSILQSGCSILRLPSSKSPPAETPLTDRQQQVLQLVAEGYTMREIACAVGIHIKTAEFHKTQLMRRLGLRSTAQLTKYALERGLTRL